MTYSEECKGHRRIILLVGAGIWMLAALFGIVGAIVCQSIRDLWPEYLWLLYAIGFIFSLLHTSMDDYSSDAD